MTLAGDAATASRPRIRLQWAWLLGGAVALTVLAGVAAGRDDWAVALGLAATPCFVAGAFASPPKTALVVIAALPFMVYTASVGGYSIFLAIPTFGLVSVLLVVGRPAPRRLLQRALPVRSYAVLVVAAFVMALASSDPVAALTKVAYLVLFGLFAWALASALATGSLTRSGVVRAIVYGGAAAGVAVSLQFAAQFVFGRQSVFDWLASIDTAFAGQHAAPLAQTDWQTLSPDVLRGIFPFLTPPSAGQYLMIALVAAVWLSRRLRPAAASAASRWVGPALVAVIAAGLLLTLSRQAWLGAVAGLVVLAAGRFRGRLLALAVPVLVVLLLVPIPGANRSFGSYLVSASDTSSLSTSTRLDTWRQGIDQIPSHAFAGVGPGLFKTLNPDPNAGNNVYYAHNILIDATVELGIAGAIALAAVLALALRTAWRRRDDLVLAMLVAYVVANMFDDVLYFPRNGLLLAAVLALSAAPAAERGPPTVRGSS